MTQGERAIAWPPGELAGGWGLERELRSVRTSRPRLETQLRHGSSLSGLLFLRGHSGHSGSYSHLVNKKSSVVGVLQEADGLRGVGHFSHSASVY